MRYRTYFSRVTHFLRHFKNVVEFFFAIFRIFQIATAKPQLS